MLAHPQQVQLAPILTSDLVEVGAFLHQHLNSRCSAQQWSHSLAPTWSGLSPNHGFLLRVDRELVGVQVAFYSRREIAGSIERFCNLAAWCVLEPWRSHGIRLVRAVLQQPGYHFTDLSPSGSVVALNRLLRFESLDTATLLIPNLPLATSWRVRVLEDLDETEQVLTGDDLRLFRDHREAAATRHFTLVDGAEHCYVMARRDRRKNLPWFMSLLHVGNPALLARRHVDFGRHLLLHHGVPFTLAEARLLQARPPLSRQLSSSRPKMFRSSGLAAHQIDNLYSELTCVNW